jgi:hypothetical protein
MRGLTYVGYTLFFLKMTSIVWSAGRNVRHVENNQVFLDNKVYAELICVGPKEMGSNVCRGLAIHYVDSDEYVWVAPKKGWQLSRDGKLIDKVPDVAREWGASLRPEGTILKGYKKITDDDFIKLDLRWNAHFSENGKTIVYNEAGIFGEKTRSYRVK